MSLSHTDSHRLSQMENGVRVCVAYTRTVHTLDTCVTMWHYAEGDQKCNASYFAVDELYAVVDGWHHCRHRDTTESEKKGHAQTAPLTVQMELVLLGKVEWLGCTMVTHTHRNVVRVVRCTSIAIWLLGLHSPHLQLLSPHRTAYNTMTSTYL